MERKSTEAALKKRIRSGKVTRDDVARRLAEEPIDKVFSSIIIFPYIPYAKD